MNHRRWLACRGLLAGGALTAVLPAPVVGEEPKGDTDKQKEAKEASEAVARLALVRDQGARGRKEKSLLALLAAAEILGKIEVPFQKLKEKPEVSGKTGPAGEVPPLLDRREEFDVLVADARSMAKRPVKDGTLTPAAAEAVGALADTIAFKGARGRRQRHARERLAGPRADARLAGRFGRPVAGPRVRLQRGAQPGAGDRQQHPRAGPRRGHRLEPVGGLDAGGPGRRRVPHSHHQRRRLWNSVSAREQLSARPTPAA